MLREISPQGCRIHFQFGESTYVGGIYDVMSQDHAVLFMPWYIYL